MEQIDKKLARRLVTRDTVERNNEKKVFESEAAFQKYVLTRLRKCPLPEISWFKTMKCNKMGVSDLIMCVKGRFVAIEFKHRGGKLSEHQSQYIKEVIAAEGVATAAWSWLDVKQVLLSLGVNFDEREIEKIKAEHTETV